MDFFKAISLKDAQQIVSNDLPSFLFTPEDVHVEKCGGRYLAQDVFSDEAYPTFRRSTVDGYALCASDTSGASESVPSILNLVGDVKMGERAQISCNSGECCYVPTGGAVPDGCNAVLMIEHSSPYADKIAVLRAVAVGENVVNVGDDVKKGALLATKGTLVTPLVIGQMGMAGKCALPVYPQICASVVSTGDELLPIGEKCQVGQINDINGVIVEEYLNRIGVRTVCRTLVKDDYGALKSTLEDCAKMSDVVFVSGGSSVGQKDYTLRLFKALGTLRFNGVAMKPGKPSLFAASEKCVFFGLPGNPMAAVVAYKTLFEETLLSKYGAHTINRTVKARAAINFPSAPGKATVQPVTLDYRDGTCYATPLFYRSALISKLAKADGYVLIDEKIEGVDKDEELSVILL